MDKYEFASSILKDLMARLTRKDVQSRNFKLITLESLIGFKNERQNELNSESNLSIHNVEQKVVLIEKDVLNLNDKQVILPAGSIITPLAKDAARRKGIQIIIERL